MEVERGHWIMSLPSTPSKEGTSGESSETNVILCRVRASNVKPKTQIPRRQGP